MDKLLTVQEAAEFLEVSRTTIYRYAERGELPHVKKKFGLRFRKEELEDWLERDSKSYAPLEEILPQLDLSLGSYDKILLKWRKELNGITRWSYSIGSVLMRKTKRKEERYSIQYQVEGHRVRKALRGVSTRAEAVKVLNQEVGDALRGKYHFQKKKISFSEFADLFLEKYSKVNKKSWKTSDWVYLRRLKPYFGSYDLSKITAEKIEEYKSERLSTGIKKCSVNREISCLRKIFNVAIDWNYAADNPVRRVKLFSEKENIRERVLAEDEEEQLLTVAAPHIKPILVVALNTGMRKSEIFKIRWQNIDFEKREIKIPESKSGRERVIPINSTLINMLSLLRAQNGRAEHVFTNPETKKPYADIKRSFSGACRRAGIDDMRFHDIRHYAEFRTMPS